MRILRGFVALLTGLTISLPAMDALAWPGAQQKLCCVNCRLHGQIVDYTHNHGVDRRIWSPCLRQWRDVYVYLPPGYDPSVQYPAALYLHGATQDEQFFVENIVQHFDEAIAEGRLPPTIIVSPDGSLKGRPAVLKTASFFANTRMGNYEDYVIQDVWQFLLQNFPVRPEREAHAILGVSMGGSASFALAIKHKDLFKVCIGFMPALNLRWVDGCGRYESKFDPESWGWRNRTRPLEVIARPPGIIKVRFTEIYGPLVGCGPEAMNRLSEFNPIEILERSDLKDGDLAMHVAYGALDEFNIDAQVESFLYFARQRGLTIDVNRDPVGRHDLASGLRMFPDAIRWAEPHLAPFRPHPANEK